MKQYFWGAKCSPLLLVLLAFSLSASAQNCFNLTDNNALELQYADGYLFAKASRVYSKKKDRETIKKDLEAQLKFNLTTNLFSSVEVTTKSIQTQSGISGEAKNSIQLNDISVNSKITAKMVLKNPTYQWCDDPKAKTMHGLILVNRNEFNKQANSLLDLAIGSLKAKLVNYQNNDYSSTVSQTIYNEAVAAKAEIDELMRLIAVVDVENTLRKNEQIQADLENINQQMNYLLAKVETGEFQLEINRANTEIADKNFREAMLIFNRISLRYPNNPSVLEARKNALQTIENAYLSKIQSSDFMVALAAVKELQNVDPSFIQQYNNLEELLQNKAFEQYIGYAQNSIQSRDSNKAKEWLDALAPYQFVNSTKYQATLNSIGENIVAERKREIDLRIRTKDYVDAYQLILKTEAEFPQYASSLREREQNVVSLLTAEKVNELKKTRPYVYQLQLGAGALSNFYSLSSITNGSKIDLLSASTLYEVGLYRKTRIHPNLSVNGRDHSRSNMIGLRLSVWVPSQIYQASNLPSNSTSSLYFTSNIYEPQLSFFTLKLINLNFGKLIGDIYDPLLPANGQKTDFYTLNIGLKPRIGNLMLHANAKLVSDLGQRNYLTASASLCLGLNFKRKFSRIDCKTVKHQVERMRNY
jgi:hypothetical protein